MTLDMQKLVTVKIDVYILYSSSFKSKFSVYSQYVLHLSSERRKINRTPFLYGTVSNFGNFNWKGNFGNFWHFTANICHFTN